MDQIVIAQYLQNRDKLKNTGTCIACQKPVQWSTDRLAAHKRSSCPDASDEEKRKFSKRKVDSLNASYNNISLDNDSSLNTEDSSSFLTEEKVQEIQTKLANFFFRTGISLRLVESEAFKSLISSLNPAFTTSIPNAKKLSGPLLDQQYEKSLERLKIILESSENLTLVSDGWTNVRGDHIVNFCIKSSDLKPFFYTSINTSGISQNAPAVAAAIIKVLEELGAQRFNCVITDHAPVMKAAWKLIETKFPHISAFGCAAHGVNLLIKDIVNTTENSKTIKEAEKIIKFVTNHHIVKAKFEEKRIAAKVPHTLSMAVATRWLSLYNSMSDLFASKYVLIQLADEEKEILLNVNPTSTSSAVLLIIKSNSFWDHLAKLVREIEYPSNIIGKLESDDASLALVYYYFGQMYLSYESEPNIQEKVLKRLKFLSSQSMGLAYVLNPEYAAKGFFFDDDKLDFMGFATDFAKKMNYENAEEIGREMIAFADEMSKLTNKRQETIFRMSAKNYWNILGRQKFPALFKVAKPIVEMICSSATAERTWSTFRFIHSRLRNRLTNERVNKLVHIYTNCVLLDEKDQNDYILDEGAILSGRDCEETMSDRQ